MKCKIIVRDHEVNVDLDQPIDISIPLREGSANAFHAPPFKAEPFRSGDFIGSVELGGPVNFMNVQVNPHGNGTHTECVGHIAAEKYTINECLKRFHFMAELVSILPHEIDNGDKVITRDQVEALITNKEVEAIIIRTLPNNNSKLSFQYSGSNPPYLHHEATELIVSKNIQHLLLDLPSVDREEDGGKLLSHRAFWQYPNNTRADATITEMIYVPDEVEDGTYLLNIQISSFELDASPSKVVLYAIDGLE